MMMSLLLVPIMANPKICTYAHSDDITLMIIARAHTFHDFWFAAVWVIAFTVVASCQCKFLDKQMLL